MVSITARLEIANLMCTADKSGRTTNCILIYGLKRLIFNSLYSLQKSGKSRLKLIKSWSSPRWILKSTGKTFHFQRVLLAGI